VYFALTTKTAPSFGVLDSIRKYTYKKNIFYARDSFNLTRILIIAMATLEIDI